MKLDKSKVTLGQWSQVYDYSPDAYQLLMNGTGDGKAKSLGDVTPKASIALLWLAKVQDDPTFTLEQAEQFTFDGLNLELSDGEAEDPT